MPEEFYPTNDMYSDDPPVSPDDSAMQERSFRYEDDEEEIEREDYTPSEERQQFTESFNPTEDTYLDDGEGEAGSPLFQDPEFLKFKQSQQIRVPISGLLQRGESFEDIDPEQPETPTDEQVRNLWRDQKLAEDDEINQYGRLLTDRERENEKYLFKMDQQDGYSGEFTKEMREVIRKFEDGTIDFVKHQLPSLKEDSPLLAAMFDPDLTKDMLPQLTDKEREVWASDRYIGFLTALNGVMWAGGSIIDGVQAAVEYVDDTIGLENIGAAIPAEENIYGVEVPATQGLRSKTIEGNTKAITRELNHAVLGVEYTDADGLPTGSVEEYGGWLDIFGAATVARGAIKSSLKLAKQAKRIARKEATQAKRIAASQARRDDPTVSKTKLNLLGATMDAAAEKQVLASKVASENQEIAEQLLKDFETEHGVKVTTEVTIMPETAFVDGKQVAKGQPIRRMVYDPEAARAAGKDITEEIAAVERRLAQVKIDKPKPFFGSKSGEQIEIEKELVELRENKDLFNVDDAITSPILNPDKFNTIVAVAADLKAKFPDAFDPNKTVIDNLFDLTVKGDLTGKNSTELLEILGSYGLSFDEYVLTVVSGGSQAGKILNKLSQIRRFKPGNELVAANRKALMEQSGTIRKLVMRVENIRRGGLVSQLKTAARNLQSAYIRSPLEVLESIMDTALYAYAGEGGGVGGIGAGVKAAVSPENWKDSFRMLKYMYGDAETARIYSDFILERPQLANQLDLLYNNLNEIQIATGRGSGTVTDKLLGEAEDLVMAINIPNRWQEMLVRRGVFFGELQRLSRREYGIDLMETINLGKIDDLLNDAPGIRPDGSRTFYDMVAESTERALSITYAKQPDMQVFQGISSFITRNGLTVVAPFPRFMFNSMELMGQYTGGASIPLTKMLTRQIKRRVLRKGSKEGDWSERSLDRKGRQQISRNITGMAGLLAAYQYRDSEDAPGDYKMMNTVDGVELDTSPIFPVRQFLFIAEMAKQVVRYGVADALNWFVDNKGEFVETFVQPLRSGVGASVVDEFLDAAIVPFTDASDLVATERVAKSSGRAIGNYLRTWAVPFQQVIDLERGLDMRGLEFKDVAKDPVLDYVETFKQEIGRTFDQSGLTLPAEEEAALPERSSSLFKRPGNRRVAPLLNFAFGLNLKTGETEMEKFFGDLGFPGWREGSKSRVPTIKRFENNLLQVLVPTIAEAAFESKEFYENQWETGSESFKNNLQPNKDSYVRTMLQSSIDKQFKSMRETYNEILSVDGDTDFRDIPEIAASIMAERPELEDPRRRGELEDRAIYLQGVLMYRRAPPKDRRASLRRFMIEYDYPADPTDPDDLIKLALIAKKLHGE